MVEFCHKEAFTVEDSVSIRRSIWISSLITLVVLAVFVGISAVIPRPSNGAALVVMGLILAIVPALVWLGFFEQQDRAEPEPKRLIARTFAFGALAAGAAAVPFAEKIVEPLLTEFPDIIMGFLITLFTIALMQEVLKLAIVRYVVLGTPEFDRHPDGIVYGLASGLGFATVLTVAYILQRGGVIPLAGAIRAVDNALVHGVLGAVTGYYIGRVKIDGKSMLWLATGIAATTLINAIYQTAQRELERSFAYVPLLDLAGAVVMAVVVGGVLFYFFRLAMRRAVGELNTVSVQAHARAKDMPWDISLRYDWLIVGGLLLSLLVAIGAGVWSRSRIVHYNAETMPITFNYPAKWAVQGEEAGAFTVRDFLLGGLYKPSLTVDSAKVAEDSDLSIFSANRIVTLEGTRMFFSEIGEARELQVAGQPALRRNYEYAWETPSGPVVLRGVETYVKSGGTVYIFRYEAEPAVFEIDLPYYEQLLRSVRFQDSN
jgi:protease PrsW